MKIHKRGSFQESDYVQSPHIFNSINEGILSMCMIISHENTTDVDEEVTCNRCLFLIKEQNKNIASNLNLV